MTVFLQCQVSDQVPQASMNLRLNISMSESVDCQMFPRNFRRVFDLRQKFVHYYNADSPKKKHCINDLGGHGCLPYCGLSLAQFRGT